MKTWIEDKNGNKCSVEFWGSKEAAQTALDSLKNCSRCSDCYGCSDCSYCSRCSDCSYCSRCSRCSYCSRCSDCSYCSRCSGCSDCSYCSRCSDCYGCSYCSDCSRCSRLKNSRPTDAVKVSVPIIENIHQKVYEAASNPKALDMSTWHTCQNTHCRAGWVVTLAGIEGKKLEEFFDTPLAAMKIYDASSSLPKVSPVRFFETNEIALVDMKRMAEMEKASHK